MRDNGPVYRVAWREGQPFIEVGRARLNRSGKTWKVLWPGATKPTTPGTSAVTIEEAVASEVSACMFEYGLGLFRKNHVEKPWAMLSAARKLARLVSKLSKRGLMRRRPSDGK